MEDVAARAGVSLGTVSNALNRPEIVSPATLQRVQKAVESLNFVRNSAARSLAGGVGNTVGLVLVDLANSLFVDISRGAEQCLHAHAKSLLIADSDVDLSRQDRNLGLFDEARVAGIILAPLDASLSRARAVRRHGRSVVLVNYAARGFCGVTVDEVHGGYLAARHLLETGRRRLLFAGGPLTLRAVAGRWSGVQKAVQEWGDGARLEHRVTASLSVREGGVVADELTSRKPGRRPDGVVAAADTLAIGVVQQLRPGEVPWCPTTWPSPGTTTTTSPPTAASPLPRCASPATRWDRQQQSCSLTRSRPPGHTGTAP